MLEDHRAKQRMQTQELMMAAPLLEVKVAASDLRQLLCNPQVHQHALEEQRVCVPHRLTNCKLAPSLRYKGWRY